MQKLVKIIICEDIAKELKKNEFNVKIKSVAEAMLAINCITKQKFSKIINKLHKEKKDFVILVNGNQINTKEQVNIMQDIETIEVVPCLVGAFWPMVVWMIVSSLISYGLNKILNPTPENISAEENPSYLINGSVNLAKQGLPVPLGYGRKKVGSQVISYSTRYIDNSSGLSSSTILSWIRYIYNHREEEPFYSYYYESSSHKEYVDRIIQKYGASSGGQRYQKLFDFKTFFPDLGDISWGEWDPWNTFHKDLDEGSF